MKFASVFAVLASAATVSAATMLATREICPKVNATEIVDKYIQVLSHLPTIEGANATAQALMVDNYSEISDSILALEGLPVSYSAIMEGNVLFYLRKS